MQTDTDLLIIVNINSFQDVTEKGNWELPKVYHKIRALLFLQELVQPPRPPPPIYMGMVVLRGPSL